tara:strand:+ start:1459 stop:2838 length:1380 start_codon:yes stop_codon:yes gene_type:complete
MLKANSSISLTSKFLFSFWLFLLLTLSSNIEANNSDDDLLTCNDPITNFRWSELCKSGFNVSFMVDHFQGKYNDSSYEDYKVCAYLNERLTPRQFEDSGQTKEEFYDGLDVDEAEYIRLSNLSIAITDYFFFSILGPLVTFNPSATTNKIVDFFEAENKRIANSRIADSNYQDNVTYGSFTDQQVYDYVVENCIPLIRDSYNEFIFKNLQKPYNEQIKTREFANILVPAFSKMDKEGKIEGLNFSDWLDENLAINQNSQLPQCPSSLPWDGCWTTHSYENGDSYAGEWKNNVFDGQGVYSQFPDQKYIGEFKDGYVHGWGTMFYSNGDKYVGEWNNDKKQGQGTYTYVNGGKYVGEWNNDKKQGQATRIYANGNKYVGTYKDGKQNGQGTIFFANGSEHIGAWKDGKRHGLGTTTFEDGSYIQGYFMNDKFIPQVCLEKGFTIDTEDYKECVLNLIDDL